MGATYTRQSSAGIVDGSVIEASDLNDEYDQLVAAFAVTTGHTHDGTAAEGGPVTKLLGTSITIGDGTAGTDIAMTFDGETGDGVITWMEDEDYFKFSDDILINSTEKIQFYDTGIYIYSSTDGQLDLVADTEIQIAATTIDINGAVAFNGAITGATDITLSGELDAATLDISGNADIDGTLEADAYTVDGTTLAEYIADTSGAMFSSNTETGITATYQDGDNTVDLAIDAAQTSITSIYATDLILGEDSQTAIDFGTVNEIDFKADNAARLTLTSSVLYPVTDNEIDLGTASLEFKDAFFDGTVTTDALVADTANIDGGSIDGATLGTNSAITQAVIDSININGTTIGHTSDTDLLTFADGLLTVAGEVSLTVPKSIAV